VYFAPLKSPIRNLFQTCIPKWILLGPEIDADWDSCLQTFEGHTDPVEDVAFSPGGNIIASAGDSTVRIWDTTIGDEKFTLKGDGEHVTTVKVSPSSGSILASGYVDGSVRLWDTATGEENLVLTGHDGYISALAFSSDGTRVASGSWDRKILVWDISTGETSLVLKGHERVSAIAFSIDDRTVASGAKDGSITIWDIATCEERLVLKGHKEKVTVLAFTADDKTMASASGDGTVRLWDTSTDEELLVFDGHDGCVSALVFLPNGKIASASCFNNVQIWDMWTGKANQSFETGLSRCAAFSPNGRIFASGLRDGTIRLRDIAIAEKEQNAEFFGVFALSPDGKTGVSEEGESIQLWDVTTGKKKGTLKGHIWDARDLIFSPNSKFIASSSWNDPAVQVWNVATGNHNWKLDWPRTEKIIFSPDSKTIALMRKDKILLLNAVTGGMTRMISNGDGRCFRDFAFFSNKTMIVLYHQGNLELFNTVTGKRKKWMKFKQSSFICDRFNFSWSKNLAVYHWKKVIILQNLTTQKVLRTIVLEHPVSALSFSADGQYLNVGRGMLNLSPDSADKQQETTNSPIFITRDWVLRDGKRLLWLPPNFRTEKLEFQDNTFMFEHSFRVGFFRFEYP
jgi:WD40 repeat protein